MSVNGNSVFLVAQAIKLRVNLKSLPSFITYIRKLCWLYFHNIARIWPFLTTCFYSGPNHCDLLSVFPWLSSQSPCLWPCSPSSKHSSQSVPFKTEVLFSELFGGFPSHSKWNLRFFLLSCKDLCNLFHLTPFSLINFLTSSVTFSLPHSIPDFLLR